MTAAGLMGLRLPFHFDAALLRRDLALIEASDWSPHYNERDFGGEWQGVALRSGSGSERDLFAGSAGAGAFSDTPLLTRCDYFRQVLERFRCPLKSVRLLSLAPGSFIREHSDNALGFEDGEVRIHVPVETNPGVEFYVCGERLLLEQGHTYYVNVNLPHRVNNRGAEGRVHLVIDAVVNDWVRAVFARGGQIARSSLPPCGFEDFAKIVCADVALRARLRAIPVKTELLKSAVTEAERLGFQLNEGDMEAAFRSSAADAAPAGPGWIPTQVAMRNGRPWATWIYAPEHRFTGPFFDEDVRACMRHPFTALFRREMPLRPEPGIPSVRPDGLIFHMSRCGSTLISRSLAAAESTLVLSEPAPLDPIVQTGRTEWLEWIVSALGNARGESQPRYVIKLDSWHIRDLPLFRRVFPDVPWIFVYRDPLEVLVSHLRQPGLQSSPGAMDPAMLGMRVEDITGMSRREWCVRVLEGFMRAALEQRDDPLGMFIDYRELPGAICGKISGHFGLQFTAAEMAAVEEATRLDAKNPYAEFHDDGAAKRREGEDLLGDPGVEALDLLYRQFQAR